MAQTTFPPRFGTEFAELGGSGSNLVTSRSDWVTAKRFRSSPPGTSGQQWWVGCSFSADISPGSTAEVRLRATDDLGGQWATDPKTVGVPTTGDLTKWVKVLDAVEASRPYFIEVQFKQEGPGFVRLTEVVPSWISTPPPVLQQPSVSASIASASIDDGDGVRSFVNPVSGSGNTLIGIAVGPGPGHDGAGDSWTEPPNATSVIDYEVQADSIYQYVQRVRVWQWTEDGSGSYSFGYDKAAGETWQQCALIALDRQVPFVRGFGPVVNVDVDTAFPSVTVVDDYQVIALSTTQQEHQMVTHPAGYSLIFDGTILGAAGQWRRMAASIRAASNATETPGGALWSAGSGEAHANFTLIIPPGS